MFIYVLFKNGHPIEYYKTEDLLIDHFHDEFGKINADKIRNWRFEATYITSKNWTEDKYTVKGVFVRGFD